MRTWKTNPALFRRQMCGLTRNAMTMVRARRTSFVARHKDNPQRPGDIVTDADRAVQAFLVEKLREEFPDVGIVAEEDELWIPPREDGGPYWTIDPIDGTHPFAQHAAHGFSVMLSLVEGGSVVAACVGDVMSGILYWFAPGLGPFWQDLDGEPRPLDGFRSPAEESSLLFGDDPRELPSLFSEMVPRAFDRFDIDRGSLGLRTARLWTGEIAALVMRGGRDWNAWDDSPVIGMNLTLGFRYLALEDGVLAPFAPRPVRVKALVPRASLVIHESRLALVRPWLA